MTMRDDYELARPYPWLDLPPSKPLVSVISPRRVGDTNAAQLAKSLIPALTEARKAGCVSCCSLARHLNEHGVPSARGGKWRRQQVKRVLARLGT
jgi:hypothetical protein